MRDVAQAFRAWTVAGGAAYAEIARHAWGGQIDAAQG